MGAERHPGIGSGGQRKRIQILSSFAAAADTLVVENGSARAEVEGPAVVSLAIFGGGALSAELFDAAATYG